MYKRLPENVIFRQPFLILFSLVFLAPDPFLEILNLEP